MKVLIRTIKHSSACPFWFTIEPFIRPFPTKLALVLDLDPFKILETVKQPTAPPVLRGTTVIKFVINRALHNARQPALTLVPQESHFFLVPAGNQHCGFGTNSFLVEMELEPEKGQFYIGG